MSKNNQTLILCVSVGFIFTRLTCSHSSATNLAATQIQLQEVRMCTHTRGRGSVCCWGVFPAVVSAGAGDKLWPSMCHLNKVICATSDRLISAKWF